MSQTVQFHSGCVYAVVKVKHEESKWLAKASPGLQQTMLTMQHMASSIAQDWCFVRGFNALGPDALLACALIVEEVMDSQTADT